MCPDIHYSYHTYMIIHVIHVIQTLYLFVLFVLLVDISLPTSTWQLRKRSVTSSRHLLLEALHPYSMAMKHDVNRCLGMKDVKDVKAVKAVWCIWLKGGFSMMYHDFIAVSSGFQYVFICFQGLNCFFWCLLMFVATLEVAIQVLVSLKMSHLWKSDVNPSCKFVCRTTNGRVSVSLPASWLIQKLEKKHAGHLWQDSPDDRKLQGSTDRLHSIQNIPSRNLQKLMVVNLKIFIQTFEKLEKIP